MPEAPVGKPLVTANQVTLARLVLLPFGTLALYLGPTGQWVALFAMTIVGCTDFVDGWLARKYGSTVLGGLMDPIADKMFVALTMLPALDLGWLPWHIVALIFLREFVITAARTAYSRRNVTLKTSYIAKVKTWYQMIVVGLLFMLAPPGDHPMAPMGLRWTLVVCAVSAVVGGLVFYAIKRRRWRGSVWFAGSFGAVSVIALALPNDAAGNATLRDILGWITVGITMLSGGGYLLGIKDLPGTARFDAHDAVRLLGAIALPLIACKLIDTHAAPAWPVFSTVAAEFAIGGLDNLLSHQKRLGNWAWWGLRVVLQNALLGAALWVALSPEPSRTTIMALELAAVAVTAIAAAFLFVINRRSYLEAAEMTRHEAA